MALSREFATHIEDLLSPLGAVSVRSMFGGGGVYLDRVMFALISNEVLYFRADDATKSAFESEGMGPFIYDGKGKPTTMPYWQVPDRLFDEHEDLVTFARAALDVARQAKKAKPAKPRRSKSAHGS